MPFATPLTALSASPDPVWGQDGHNHPLDGPELTFWRIEELHERLEAAALERPC